MLNDTRAGISRLLLKHPDWGERLERAVAADEIMVALCADYAAAWRGLEYWHGSGGPKRAQRLADYHNGLVALEVAITDRLEQIR